MPINSYLFFASRFLDHLLAEIRLIWDRQIRITQPDFSSFVRKRTTRTELDCLLLELIRSEINHKLDLNHRGVRLESAERLLQTTNAAHSLRCQLAASLSSLHETTCQFLLSSLPIRHATRQEPVELRPVVVDSQMAQLVHYDVFNAVPWRLDKL